MGDPREQMRDRVGGMVELVNRYLSLGGVQAMGWATTDMKNDQEKNSICNYQGL